MMQARIGILISGSGSNMVSLIRSMDRADHPGRPVLVLSNRPDAPGIEKAASLGVETVAIDHRAFGKDRAAFDAAMLAALQARDVNMVACAGFMRIMTAPFVAHWRGRMLNIHPSILPLFKGLNTHARALDAGMAVHGCTVHEVTPDLDGGKILGQAVVPVEPGDTADTLGVRVLAREHVLYPAVLERFLRDPEAARRAPVALL